MTDDFLETDFYNKHRKFGNHTYTDENVWFMPVNLLIRRNKDDSIKEIIIQYEGMKLKFFAIRVKDGKMVIK